MNLIGSQFSLFCLKNTTQYKGIKGYVIFNTELPEFPVIMKKKTLQFLSSHNVSSILMVTQVSSGTIPASSGELFAPYNSEIWSIHPSKQNSVSNFKDQAFTVCSWILLQVTCVDDILINIAKASSEFPTGTCIHLTKIGGPNQSYHAGI